MALKNASLFAAAAAVVASLAMPVAAQDSLFDQLRDRTIDQGGAARSDAPSGGGQGLPNLDAVRTPSNVITNRPRGPEGARSAKPPAGNAEARRRMQELEARQLQQQIDQLQGVPHERNEFQAFVYQSTGRDLPIFGANLFRNVPSTFAPVDGTPVAADYVIGAGDEIIVTGWGQIEVDLSLIVERNGTVSIPRIGAVPVAGLRFSELQPRLKAAFNRVFRNFELSVTLGQLRAIQVFVVGQARNPGTYTLSSLSTLVNAIFAAGGPSAKGSMRSIQLKRDNRVVADFDLYDLLVGGDKSRDAPLQPGDIIQFLPVGSLVAVTGSVNVPAVYELKHSAPLFDVLRWSGGLATTAAGKNATVERIAERKARTVEDFPLDMSGLSRPLRDGDLVTVHALTPKFDNAVTLRGSVAQPGRFPWREGLRVRDLIPEREALLSREYWIKRNQAVGLEQSAASLLRQQDVTGTRLTLEDLRQRRLPEGETDATIGDTIRRVQTEAEAARFLDPTGSATRPPAQARPGSDVQRVEEPPRLELARLEEARNEAARLVNQIRPPALDVNWDYAVIERLNRDDLTTQLLPFNLEKAIKDADPQHNLPLQPGDVVTIFAKSDVRIPESRKTRYIRLEGELNHGGVYQILPGETLRQLLVRVGGVSPNAYLFGAQFTRESTRIQQQRNLDEALNRLERDIQRANITRAQNLTTAEDAASLRQQSEDQTRLVSKLRQIRPLGRIVLALPESAALKDLPDLPLEDGDRLLVPARPSMVSVFGSVYSENSFVYAADKRVNDYLAQAGGPTKSADRGSIYVLRADGSVLAKPQAGLFGNFGSTALMPGDAIVVPEELDRTTTMRALRDISQIFYQFGLGAAAIKVLKD